jgi:hypothetical protein
MYETFKIPEYHMEVMVELSINPLIIKKIKALDDDDEFKELLLNLLDFEKLRNNLGEKEYTAEYDRRITDFVNKHGTV